VAEKHGGGESILSRQNEIILVWVGKSSLNTPNTDANEKGDTWKSQRKKKMSREKKELDVLSNVGERTRRIGLIG